MKFSKCAQVLTVVAFLAAVSFGQQLRGYSVGRYEGLAFNTTRNQTGKVSIEIQTIDSATGAVAARFTASEGLTGAGDLSGKIDAAGVLRLSGTVGDWKITLAAKVKADEIKANYKLTGAGAAQSGNFAIKLTDDDDVAPPDDEAMVAPPADANNQGVKPVAPPIPQTTTKPPSQTSGDTRRQNDDVEKSGYPKPDFSEMTRWYDIQAYNYDVFGKQLIFMVKATVESRPTDYKVEYLDKDGVVLFSNQFYGLWHADLLNKPEKFSVTTPGETDMAKVKIVRFVRLKQ
jgi:hypothetical protein